MLGYTKKFIHGTRAPERALMFGTQVTRIMPVLEDKTFANISSKGHVTTEEYNIIHYLSLSLLILYHLSH